MNDTIDKIDVTKSLANEDFVSLFTGQLTLTPDELKKLSDVYYALYVRMIESEVAPEQAWVAIRNLFITQEPQIGERTKNGNN
jgi:hypothetical protein